MTEPAQRSWWNRNWKWVVPVGCLTPIICCGGFVGVIVTIAFGAIKSSDVYKDSVHRATADARVIELLGDPIEPGLLAGGNINIQNDTGNANLAIPLSGPKGSATLRVIAEKKGGQWHPSTLEVESADGSTNIDLLAP
jgi:hypothetical protein